MLLTVLLNRIFAFTHATETQNNLVKSIYITIFAIRELQIFYTND